MLELMQKDLVMTLKNSKNSTLYYMLSYQMTLKMLGNLRLILRKNFQFIMMQRKR
jgi:hypothetical protein